MVTPVEMPKLGNTVEECLLGAWRKQVGDTVAAGEVIADIETDKTSFELEAPVGGVLLDTFFDAGALVPVFTVICAIGAPGESAASLRGSSATGSAPAEYVPTGSAPAEYVPTGSAPAEAVAAGSVPVDTPPTGIGAGPPANGESDQSEQSEARGAAAATERRGAAASTEPRGAAASSEPTERNLSPRARRFAREHDFHPASVPGSGPSGRVLEDDLRRAWHAGIAELPFTRATATGTDKPAAARMSPIRERIAKRLRESLSTTAQYTLHTSANAGGLLVARKRFKAPGAGPMAEVNIGDMVAFCAVQALLEVPQLNATLADGQLSEHAAVHLGFACDTDRGLMVPVVRDSQDLSLLGLARRMKELAAQAIGGTISVDDLTGGTFTVTNLGSFGIESFTPVLNPPQVAVLGVDAIGVKPVRKADGNLEFIDAIGLSLTLDHQVVDGAPGARFLKVLREKIETVGTFCTT